MKKTILLALVLFSVNILSAQDTRQKTDIANANLKTLDGKNISSSVLGNDGKPFVLDFWATWCKPCVAELSAISEDYSDWKTETGIKIIAVSIDDSRTMASVAPFVAGKNWDYEIYLDPNSDFRRAMNVNNVPHVFLFDGNGKIVSQHNTYTPGDEEKLLEEIKKMNVK